jgi:hypothetical protein
MEETKEKILSIMSTYYHDKDKALEWYEKPNSYFSVGFNEKASPKEMVDNDKGKEVLEWLKLLLY